MTSVTMLQLCDAIGQDYASAVAARSAVEPDGITAAGASVTIDDLGYGADLSCDSDLRADMGEVDPTSPEAVSQALWRRINTPAGFLGQTGDDVTYGRDIQALLHADMTTIELMAQTDLLTAECLKDDRLATCNVSLVDLGQGIFDLEISGELATGVTYLLIEKLSSAKSLQEDMAR